MRLPLSSLAPEPVALVTVWALPSSFFQVTAVPWVIARFSGLNVEPVMQTCVAVGVQPPPPPPPPLPPPYSELLHPTAVPAASITIVVLIRIVATLSPSR